MSTPKSKGRPRKKTEERRDKQIHVRATAAELAAWEQAAKREGRTVTNLARYLLNTTAAAFLPAALALLALSSCAPGRGVLLVTVAAPPGIASAIAALDVGVAREGAVADGRRLPVPPGAALRFSLSFTPQERGDVTVIVDAVDDADNHLARGTAAATVVPSRLVDVALTLGEDRAAPPPDGGADLVAVDALRSDLAPAGDLAAADLTPPAADLVAAVDLVPAAPDLAPCGPCAPGATQQGSCDPCSEQTCGNDCQWAACALKAGNACEYRDGNNSKPCDCGALAPSCVFVNGTTRSQGGLFCSPQCQWNGYGSQCVCGLNCNGSVCSPAGAC